MWSAICTDIRQCSKTSFVRSNGMEHPPAMDGRGAGVSVEATHAAPDFPPLKVRREDDPASVGNGAQDLVAGEVLGVAPLQK